MEGLTGIPFEEIKGKDVEQGGVGEEEAILFQFHRSLVYRRASLEQAGGGLYTGKLGFEQRGGRRGKDGQSFGQTREFREVDDAVDAIELLLVVVETYFIANEEHDQKTAGHANGESEDIDEGKGFALSQLADGDEDEVPDHRFSM